ncbi:MAG: FeoA domain-containing protein [Lachnospiraceae bacterium]|nr:FeoA domain-containing protein [Lachnospiraceae bacterium]
MKLNEGTIGSTYLVKSVVVDDTITRRLEALGVNEMTPITILNKKGSGSVIFQVRGTRLAVGHRISDGIELGEERAHG